MPTYHAPSPVTLPGAEESLTTQIKYTVIKDVSATMDHMASMVGLRPLSWVQWGGSAGLIYSTSGRGPGTLRACMLSLGDRKSGSLLPLEMSSCSGEYLRRVNI